jgi:hypothetical protein
VALLSLLADQAAASLQLIMEARRIDAALQIPGPITSSAADSQAIDAVDGILRHVRDFSANNPDNDEGVQLLISLSRVLSDRSRDARSAR